MSFAEIEKEVPRLSDDERQRLLGLLVAIDTAKDTDLQDLLARKIDDSNPSHWVALQDFEKQVGLQD